MKQFTVYFEIYGKKMKTSVVASSSSEAGTIVRSKLSIVKVVPEQSIMDELFNIVNGKK